ncbi:MAG: phosphatidate cytidylyltransferase, partial [Anaerovoracaceae bacterium]
MKTRVISGLIMVPFLVIFYFGGMVLTAACFVIGIMGIYEFYKGFHKMGIKPNYLIGFVATIALYVINLCGGQEQWYMLWFFGVVLSSLLYLFRIHKRRLEDAMATVLGVFYVVFFSFHVVLVDQTGAPSILVWLIVFSAFGTDVMAYFTGFAFGKHKLCPKISPKKTIEGS